MTDTVSRTLAIVGAGPSCTYVLERIAAKARASEEPLALRIVIYERTGEFGDGQVHSASQPKSSFLNRIAGQVSFAADETVEGAADLLPAPDRLPLDAWARLQFKITGNTDLDLSPEDWPKRYVHGLALKRNFEHYITLLRKIPGVEVRLLSKEVIDVIDRGDTRVIVTATPGPSVHADHVLFLTGHSSNSPKHNPHARELHDFAQHAGVDYVPSAYPLHVNIPDERIGSETVVACDGSGLTALDVILYLTEGRDGSFTKTAEGELRYVPSGREPARIVPVSHSGLLLFARPFNAKEADLERFEHRGVFLTDSAIDRVRESYGVPADLGRLGIRKQLDFETTVWPLMQLEMAHVWYATLLGDRFEAQAIDRVGPAFESFLDGNAHDLDGHARTAMICDPLHDLFRAVAAALDEVFAGRRFIADNSDESDRLRAMASRFLLVALGDTDDRNRILEAITRGQPPAGFAAFGSPWGHALRVVDHRFDWEQMIRPIPAESMGSPADYAEAMTRFMRRDHLWAAQNNLLNPHKAAADGVWRDLRQTLAHAADFGGFTADSQRTFLHTYMRHHNRLANGAALEVMEKMLALIEFGILDMSVGPRATITPDIHAGRFRISGAATGADLHADCVIDARVHPFDPARDVLPLYRKLIERGMVRQWVNPGPDGGYSPGGLELTESFHAIRADGSVDPRLTFLGPPTEGMLFFQLGALRPNQNHHVMADILAWLNGFWAGFTSRQDRVSQRKNHAEIPEVKPGTNQETNT